MTAEATEHSVIFHEEQHLSPWFLALIIGATAMPLVGGFGFGMIRQLVFDSPGGNNPISDMALALPE